MASFLLTYQPLAFTPAGRVASKKYRLAPFLDGSCRREPSFSAKWTLITSLCRPNHVGSLQLGDRLMYLARRGDYRDYAVPMGSVIPLSLHWRLVAILQVRDHFSTHQDAADHYHIHGLAVPNNLIVLGSDPDPWDQTHQRLNERGKTCGQGCPVPMCGGSDLEQAQATIKRWDKVYQERARNNGKVVLCETLFCELNIPPALTLQQRKELDGGKLATTRLRARLSERQFSRYAALANVQLPS